MRSAWFRECCLDVTVSFVEERLQVRRISASSRMLKTIVPRHMELDGDDVVPQSWRQRLPQSGPYVAVRTNGDGACALHGSFGCAATNCFAKGRV